MTDLFSHSLSLFFFLQIFTPVLEPILEEDPGRFGYVVKAEVYVLCQLSTSVLFLSRPGTGTVTAPPVSLNGLPTRHCCGCGLFRAFVSVDILQPVSSPPIEFISSFPCTVASCCAR